MHHRWYDDFFISPIYLYTLLWVFWTVLYKVNLNEAGRRQKYFWDQYWYFFGTKFFLILVPGIPGTVKSHYVANPSPNTYEIVDISDNKELQNITIIVTQEWHWRAFAILAIMSLTSFLKTQNSTLSTQHTTLTSLFCPPQHRHASPVPQMTSQQKAIVVDCQFKLAE